MAERRGMAIGADGLAAVVAALVEAPTRKQPKLDVVPEGLWSNVSAITVSVEREAIETTQMGDAWASYIQGPARVIMRVRAYATPDSMPPMDGPIDIDHVIDGYLFKGQCYVKEMRVASSVAEVAELEFTAVSSGAFTVRKAEEPERADYRRRGLALDGAIKFVSRLD